jgi:hypothetical protein
LYLNNQNEVLLYHLDHFDNYIIYKLVTLVPTGVKTRPENRTPSRRVFINPCLTNFLPEHFFGSQCSRSHMAIGKGNGHSCSGSINNTN